jgi:hypothetical protein
LATGRIGTTPVLTVRWSKAPAAGTTSLSGLDDNSVSLVYSVGYEQVYLNGALLSRTNDYTATNGTTITLTNATVAGDIVEVIANAVVPLTDTYTQSQANGKFINNTLTTTTGDIIYASAANTPARLGIGSTDQVLKVSSGIPAWGAVPATTPTFVGTVLRRSTNQTISNATLTAVAFTQETLDTNGFHDNSTNNTRVTIPSGYAGKYMFIWNQVWTSNSTGYRKANLYLNGASTSQLFSVAAANGDQTSATGTVTFSASVGDYFEVYVIQNSGGNLDMIDNSYFQVIYLGV